LLFPFSSTGFAPTGRRIGKGLSKEVIRKVADYFKVSQEAFNRPYKLINPINAHLKNESVMNTKKELSAKV
jgi:HTH-type transcriptional regulator/antitoxin HigA